MLAQSGSVLIAQAFRSGSADAALAASNSRISALWSAVSMRHREYRSSTYRLPQFLPTTWACEQEQFLPIGFVRCQLL